MFVKPNCISSRSNFHLSLLASRSQSEQMQTNRRRRHSASVLVETALCLSFVLLPLSIGIVQYGVVLSASNQLEQISREGARFASVHCLEPTFDGADTQADPPSLRYYLKNNIVANKTSILWADLNGTAPSSTIGYIQVTPAFASRSSGQAVSVKVCYPMRRKIFTGKMTQAVDKLDNDYVSTSTYIIE